VRSCTLSEPSAGDAVTRRAPPEHFVALDPVGFATALGEAARSLATQPSLVIGATRGFASASGLAALRALDGSAASPWHAVHEVFARNLRELVAAVEADPQLSAAARRKLEFLAEQAVAAAAPENWPWSNPAVLRTALDTGGRSLLRGARNALRDLTTNGGLPRQMPTTPLVPGRELATTPGAVVFRNRLVEVIQYAPRTPQVHAVPLLVSPPWVNKYYVLDLAPGRSLVEWALAHGHTVFAISYRNPDAALRDLTMSDYLTDGLLASLDVVTEITGAPDVNVVALCLGGTLAAAGAAWHAARGERRIRSLTLLNTLLDFTDPGPLGTFTDEPAIARLERVLARTGYLPAAGMKAVFDVLRARDLLWGYAVSGWLLGEDPAPSDLLAWNADATRMPAAMQIEYLRTCYLENRLAEGKLELAGERLDLGAVRIDSYVVGAITDHIAPWTSVHAGARLLGGPVRFVLTTAGHIAGVVNPPASASRRHHWTDAPLAASPEEWRAAAVERPGSWWPDWTEWLGARAGDLVSPPPTGSVAHPPIEPAPGSYVLEP
jgi:polyhydroxyalkanoate synthase subunit PhaC